MNATFKMDKTYSTSEARQKLGDIINEVFYQRKVYEITKGNNIRVLVISVNDIIDNEGIWNDEIVDRLNDVEQNKNIIEEDAIYKEFGEKKSSNK